MTKTISGTREWSVESVNCILGCPHRCRYCYARADALRRKQISHPQEWGNSYLRVREAEVRKKRRLVEGTVMFPTTHDITPDFLGSCLEVIQNILAAGNRLLIVTKPHLKCIKAICRRFEDRRHKILFRFTIGTINDHVLSYWEPGAPPFSERLVSLVFAHRMGFRTSVSCEPLLEAEYAHCLAEILTPWITDTIWFGKMNGIRSRVIPGTDPAEIARIEEGQDDISVRQIYESLKDRLNVRCKDSYKRVLGLELAEQAGMDV